METILNDYQTSIEDLHLDKYSQEVQDKFWEFFYNVPLIQTMVAPDRPRAKDLPRDKDGKIIVDITKPHIIEDSDYFRPSALHFLKTGKYTELRPNPNPNSEYGKWIREEVRRCREGYVRESDGEWITGDYYFFLNYCPMLLAEKDDITSRKAKRKLSFPRFWDGHYLKFHYLEQARQKGKHAIELASRQKGKSFCAAGLLTKRFELGESADVNKKVTCYATAAEKGYLVKGDQTLDKFQYNIDFLAQHTEFPRKRLINTIQNMQWVMGYQDLDTGARKGTLNAVMGVTAKDDESKLRGTRGVLYIIEEAGSFPRLIQLWGNMLPSVEDGDDVYGMLFAYGCCCAGTKVFGADGDLINIEDVSTSIMGFNGESASVEDVTYIQPETYKECVEIVTTNGSIKCSTDHPLLAVNRDLFGHSKNTCSFYRVNELKPGDLLLMHGNDKFGNINVKDAYLLGALFGDGSYSGNQCVTLSITTEEEYDFYNSNYDIGISKLRNTSTGGLYAQIYFKGLHPLLKEYEMDGQAFGGKKLPKDIWKWDRESIANFLAGYFDADGNVQIIKEKHRSVKLSCKYKNILEDVSLLLQKFGIYSYILKEDKPGGVLKSTVNHREYNMQPTTVYVLYICNGNDIINFRENIPIKIQYKKDRLDSYTLSKGRTYYSSLDFVYRPENGKGKYFIDKSLKWLKGTKIIEIKPLGRQRIYNLTANTTHTYLTNGFISSNTSGDSLSDFYAMSEMMYHPDGYHVYATENVYDMVGKAGRQFAFFFPGYMNRANCYDGDGNSDVTKALLEIILDRDNLKYNSTDASAITKRIAEIPIVPQEAILRTIGNMFPVAQLSEKIGELDADPNSYSDIYIGTLTQDSNGEVKFTPTYDTPIRNYPLQDNKDKGALEIFNMPEKDNSGKVFSNRYIIGYDPVNNDRANTASLSSIFVFDLFTDKIVAEYTGRTDFSDDSHELVRKLCLFYNAKCLYENNVKGCYAYFSSRRCLHLLADTPEYLIDKQVIKTRGFGNTAKGVGATTPINNYADRMLRDWLLKPNTITVEEGGEYIEKSVPNLYFLRNRALLRELCDYNPEGNFDRIRAMGMVMLYRGQFIDMYEGDLSRAGNQEPVEEDDYFKHYDEMIKVYEKDFN